MLNKALLQYPRPGVVRAQLGAGQAGQSKDLGVAQLM